MWPIVSLLLFCHPLIIHGQLKLQIQSKAEEETVTADFTTGHRELTLTGLDKALKNAQLYQSDEGLWRIYSTPDFHDSEMNWNLTSKLGQQKPWTFGNKGFRSIRPLGAPDNSKRSITFYAGQNQTGSSVTYTLGDDTSNLPGLYKTDDMSFIINGPSPPKASFIFYSEPAGNGTASPYELGSNFPDGCSVKCLEEKIRLRKLGSFEIIS